MGLKEFFFLVNKSKIVCYYYDSVKQNKLPRMRGATTLTRQNTFHSL